MMLRWFFSFLLFCCFAASLSAATLTADVAPKQLSIGGIFGGASLTVFGRSPTEGDLIGLLQGPEGSFVVHKKEKQLVFWINGPSKKLSSVPRFYQIAATTHPDTILDADKQTEHRIGMNSLFVENDGTNKYTDAFVRLKTKMGHYAVTQAPPEKRDDGSYRIDFTIPSNIPTGEYTIRVFHIENNNITASIEKNYTIAETGFAQGIGELIRGNSLLFSFFAIASALVLGLLGAMLMPRR